MTVDDLAQPFAEATAVRPDPAVAGRWHATIPPSWNSPGGIHGGMLAATLLRAVRSDLDDPELWLRSAHLSFRERPEGHDLVVDVEQVRRGGITAHLEATIRGAEQARPAATVTTLFTRARPGVAAYLDAVPPAVPGPEACEAPPESATRAASPLPWPPFFDHIELRPALGRFGWDDGWSPDDGAHYARWNRYRVPVGDPTRAPAGAAIGGGFDPLVVLPFADLPGAAVWARFGPGSPTHGVTSLEMTTHFLEPPTEEWMLTDIRARWMGDGYVHTETDVWCADRLVAVSSQLMLVRVFPPREGSSSA